MTVRRLLLATVAVLAASAAPARTPAEIRASGYLTIGTSGTAAPYSGVDTRNRLVGFDIDLGEAIGRALGVPVRWKKIDFRGLLPALGSGELDLVMSAARIRPQLTRVFLFSAPYSSEMTVAVTPAADRSVQRMADIRGHVVAVVATSYQDDVAHRIGGYADLLELPNGTDVFLAMHTGHASVGITGVTAAEHYAKHGRDRIRIVRSGAPLAPQGIVMQHDATALKAAVDRIVATMRADGSYARLYHKHFGAAPS